MKSNLRNLFLVFLLLMLFSSLNKKNISAQTSTPAPQDSHTNEDAFNDAFKTYQLKIEDYNKIHTDYAFYRAQFIKYRTLQSQTDAIDATKKMLQTRDDVVIAYLNVLDHRFDFTIGITDVDVAGYKKQLASEMAWFDNHRQNVESAGTLSDLVADSNSANKRYTSDTSLFYQIASDVAFGRLIDYTDRTKTTFSGLNDKLDKIRNETDEVYQFSPYKFQILDRWIFEAESRIARNDEKIVSIRNGISAMLKGVTPIGYSSMVSTLGQSQLYLKETISYMKEVIQSVKTGE